MNQNVLAVVNGKNITREDLNRFMMQLGNNAARYANPEGEKVLVQELVHQELFLQDALTQNMKEEAEFKALLESEMDQILKTYAVRKCLSEATVSDDEVKAYYEAHIEEFKKPEQVRASHILVDTEAAANVLYDDIMAGQSFEAVAMENSKCPSKERGGDLGFFGRGQMVPEFEQAAFNMTEGEISRPVGTQFGFHLIQLTGKSEGGYMSFDEVSFDLLKDLTMQRQNERYMAKVEALKGAYTVEIL